MQTLPANIYSVASVREIDRMAIEYKGIPGYTLMQRAGAAAVRAARARYPEAKRWQVICGAGNNGGDGSRGCFPCFLVGRCRVDRLQALVLNTQIRFGRLQAIITHATDSLGFGHFYLFFGVFDFSQSLRSTDPPIRLRHAGLPLFF